MDLNKFYSIKAVNHFAEELKVGDRCIATIRHDTDGSKNIFNANVIVVKNLKKERKIKGFFNGIFVYISYNDLQKI